jgi:hypothetical protein
VTSSAGSANARRATPADIDAITAAFTSAFFHDPVWGPVFPDESLRAVQSAPMWRVYATAALRYPWTFVTPGAEAAAIWIPPGGTELTDEEAGRLRELIEETAASGTGEPDSNPAPRSPCHPAALSRPCGARPADADRPRGTCRGYCGLETQRKKRAPEIGLEPITCRLTAGCSAN